MKVAKLFSAGTKAFAGLCCGAVGVFGLVHSGGVDGALVPVASAGLAGSGAVLLKQAVAEAVEAFNDRR